VEPRAVLARPVRRLCAVADNKYCAEDISRHAHVRTPNHTADHPHVMQCAAGRRDGGIEERPGEECCGIGRRGAAGTAGSPNVIDLDHGLDRGDGSGVGEAQEEAAFVLALVGVRLSIVAVEQAQPVVLDLQDGLSAGTFFFPDPLVRGEWTMIDCLTKSSQRL
jgi:hypothetical protein